MIFSHECFTCKEKFTSKKEASKFCSRPCMWAQNGKSQKKNDRFWKNKKGYIEGVIVLSDGTVKSVKEHRLIYERHHNVTLSVCQDIHHINGIKDDNRIENLELISHGDHTILHNKTRKYRKGYKLNISDEERKMRAERIKKSRAWEFGQAALAKARGEVE